MKKLLILLFVAFWAQGAFAQSLADWAREFPKGDFAVTEIPFREIEFDGNTRDSIPPIDDPQYIPVADADQYGEFEPVITVNINGDARAYPLQIMLWHEIVNDVIGGEPLLVSYCPLCNSGVVFDRRVDGQLLDFGNTGRIRHLDMVMYDRQTESWWQQFTGGAIIGELTGLKMELVPSRFESMSSFRARHPDGLVLVPNDPGARPYGTTPFQGMESFARSSSRFNQWPLPEGVNATQYMVVANGRAWPVERIREAGILEEAGLTFEWTGEIRNSLHDSRQISRGRELSNIVVKNPDGSDAPHDIVFAFSFSAFVPDGEWMLGN